MADVRDLDVHKTRPLRTRVRGRCGEREGGREERREGEQAGRQQLHPVVTGAPVQASGVKLPVGVVVLSSRWEALGCESAHLTDEETDR